MIPRPLLTCVMDASAVLAFLFGEAGGDAVRAALQGAAVSSVNWAEILQKAQRRNIPTGALRSDLAGLGLDVLPFTHEDAELAAALWPLTKSLGLSLGDRACLGLGQRLNLVVLTADRAWTRLQLGIPIRTIR